MPSLQKNAYKAETEIIDFVANLLKINKQEAEEQDISVIVEAIKADKSFATFFLTSRQIGLPRIIELLNYYDLSADLPCSMWEELAKYSVGKERDKAIETKWLARFPLMVQGYLPVIEYEDFVNSLNRKQEILG